MVSGPYAGDKAPDFTMPAVRCGEFTLSAEVRVSPVLLYFYPADYGMMCTYYAETMNEYAGDFKKAGIRVMYINPGSVGEHEGWMRRVSSAYDNISDIDQKVSRMYGMLVGSGNGPDVTPMTNRGFVLVDGNMTVRYVWRAEMAALTLDLGPLISELREILGQPAAAVCADNGR